MPSLTIAVNVTDTAFTDLWMFRMSPHIGPQVPASDAFLAHSLGCFHGKFMAMATNHR